MKSILIIPVTTFSLCLWLPITAQTENTAQRILSTQIVGKAVQFDSALHNEIVAMADHDQKARNNAGPRMSMEEIDEMKRVDQIHEKRMKEIVAQHGWPGKSLVGSDGSYKAWLIVQHCSLPFQEMCLPLLERAVATGEATGKNFAYLLDRVRMCQGKPQVYGTQFQNYSLWKLEDPEHVDERRRTVGLGPLAEYTERMMYRLFKIPDKPPQLTPGAEVPRSD